MKVALCNVVGCQTPATWEVEYSRIESFGLDPIVSCSAHMKEIVSAVRPLTTKDVRHCCLTSIHAYDTRQAAPLVMRTH
jgi:hypothetical protein